MSRIFIVGAGLIGLATGRALLAASHHVTFIDTDRARVAELTECGLDAQPQFDLRGEGESFIVITLPTPAAAGRAGPGYDLTILREGVRSIGRALATADSRHIVVMRSTVPPRTTDGMVRHLLERISGKRAGSGFDLVCLPEFLRPAHADHDAQWPVLTVIGAQDQRVADRVARELAPFGGAHHRVGSTAAAEMIKCAYLLQRSVNAAFWTEMSHVAQRLGIESGQISHVLSAHHEPMSGPEAYEVKDAEAFLISAAEAGAPVPLLAAAVATSAHERHVLARRALPRRRDNGPGLISLDPLTAAAPNGRS